MPEVGLTPRAGGSRPGRPVFAKSSSPLPRSFQRLHALDAVIADVFVAALLVARHNRWASLQLLRLYGSPPLDTGNTSSTSGESGNP